MSIERPEGKRAVLDSSQSTSPSPDRGQVFRMIADHTPTWESWLPLDSSVPWVNPSVERITGYTPVECLELADYPRSLLAPEDRCTLEYMLVEARAGRSSSDMDVDILHKDGQRTPVALSSLPVRARDGRILGVRLSARSIATAKRLDDRLRSILQSVARAAGTRFFEQLTKSLLQGIAADLVLIGRYHDSAPTVTTLAVCGGGEMMPNFTYDLVDTPCASVLGQGACIFPRDVPKLFPRDTMLVEMGIQGYVGAALYDSQNRPSGILVALFKDCIQDAEFVRTMFQLFATRVAAEMERTEAEEALQALNADLDRLVKQRTEELSETVQRLRDTQSRLVIQEKLASLGALTAGIAHEIKNPLNFINNFAELCATLAVDLAGEVQRQGDRLAPASVEAISEMISDLEQNCAKIRAHGKRADGIVEAMLEHSRTGHEGEKRAQDINALLKEYLVLGYDGFRSQSPHCDVELETSWDESLPPTHVASRQIGRVIVNLIQNACYAVTAKRQQAGAAYSPRIKVFTRGVGGDIEIRVWDNGAGIPRAVHEKIFTPFFTTKPPGDGTGLGLSMSHEIVRGHGGTLRFETDEGQYAEFIIRLPISPG